jgi:hypothetical protein
VNALEVFGGFFFVGLVFWMAGFLPQFSNRHADRGTPSPRWLVFLCGSEPWATAKQWMYENSHLARYTEEAAAETYATRSLGQGLRHPFHSDYRISRAQLAAEGTVVAAGTAAAGYGAYQVFQE